MISPSRALSTQKGDQLARTELLGKLLLAVSDKPYMLSHGTGRSAYNMILMSVSDEEITEIANKTGSSPTVISMGKLKLLPLQLVSGSNIGKIDSKYYDVDKKRWTSTISLMGYK